MKIIHKYLAIPLSAQLEVTNSCNHRCIHCYNLDSDLQNRPHIQIADDTILACAQKLIDYKIFSVVITGGEPLVKKNLTKRAIDLFRKNNVRVSLNTNLTLLTDDFLSFLKEKGVGVLTSCPSAILTSFEKLVGVNSYESFEKKVKLLLEARIPLTVNMVVTKNNLNEIRTTAQKMRELGVRSFAATPMSLNMEYPRFDLLLSTEEVLQVIDDLLWSEKELGLHVDVLEALPKCIFSKDILLKNHSFLNRKCQAGRTTLAVSCNGDVRPCAHNPSTYGNILVDDLKLIWKQMNEWRSIQLIPTECQECTWLHYCNGGCRTNAKTLYGKWDAQDVWVKDPIKFPIPPKYKKTIALKDDTCFRVNKNFLCRQEYDDVFVLYNVQDNDYLMVNNMCYEFILDITSVDTITFKDLQIRYGISLDNNLFYDTILFLVQKGILKIL